MIQLKMHGSSNEWNYYKNTSVFCILLMFVLRGRGLGMTFSKSGGVALPLFVPAYFTLKLKLPNFQISTSQCPRTDAVNS